MSRSRSCRASSRPASTHTTTARTTNMALMPASARFSRRSRTSFGTPSPPPEKRHSTRTLPRKSTQFSSV